MPRRRWQPTDEHQVNRPDLDLEGAPDLGHIPGRNADKAPPGGGSAYIPRSGPNLESTSRAVVLEPEPESNGATIVVIPTYNEHANIGALLDELLALDPDLCVLVVDDNSPDGTADLVEAYHDVHTARVYLLRRPAKLGLGTAYVEGFEHALSIGSWDRLLQMDADFSHPPEILRALLRAIDDADVVVGSRFAPGGSTPQFNGLRKLLSRSASWFVCTALGLRMHDPTGGLKCFRRTSLERIDLSRIRSKGFAFQIEMNWICDRLGMRTVEVPIRFDPRRAGRSKMSVAIVWEALLLTFALRRTAVPAVVVEPRAYVALQ